jgi:hypothetical protein
VQGVDPEICVVDVVFRTQSTNSDCADDRAVHENRESAAKSGVSGIAEAADIKSGVSCSRGMSYFHGWLAFARRRPRFVDGDQDRWIRGAIETDQGDKSPCWSAIAITAALSAAFSATVTASRATSASS